ncbi:MAG: quinoprotein dehydrogenase-associated SoxYZ-like carrier [Methylococcales bacterium]|nr:quinoprotein dehydrogenase-associated SoxYZ-like carrier [Methylococcales bacterium]
MLKKIAVGMAGLLLLPALTFAAEDEQVWNSTLKGQYFSGKNIVENTDIISLETPYRAEDPALVPLTISSKIPQTAERYIKKILVLVDNNPFPFVAEFDLTPESGKADLSMRVRINTYSFVRAIAEMNTGELVMAKQFVKASGGCSAPIGADMDAAMQRLGKMKFKLDPTFKAGEPSLAQLLISHPNVTGMQMDQVTRFIKKSHFVEKMQVTFEGRPVLTAKTDIAISSDPNFRFYFVPKSNGVLKAEIMDTACESPTSRKLCTPGKTYSQTVDIKL